MHWLPRFGCLRRSVARSYPPLSVAASARDEPELTSLGEKHQRFGKPYGRLLRHSENAQDGREHQVHLPRASQLLGFHIRKVRSEPRDTLLTIGSISPHEDSAALEAAGAQISNDSPESNGPYPCIHCFAPLPGCSPVPQWC